MATFILTFAFIFVSVEAKFTFILNVRSHSTEGSCDPWPVRECETYFSLFCLRYSSAEPSNNIHDCPLGANRSRFEQQTGTRSISSDQLWPITFQLFIEALDRDLNSDDHVDDIFISGSLTNSDITPEMTVSGSRVTMRVQFQRVCHENYYDVSCGTYCISRNDDNRGHYTCNPNNGAKHCLPGYEGRDCQENTNDCLPNPCSNGGNCMDLLLNFACECPPGYTGKNCSVDINECAENYCPGNSTCEDYVSEYRCVCNYGYTGHNCTQVLDPCDVGPCNNGGTCVSVDPFSSMCVCPAGYTGPVCELNINNCLNANCPSDTSCLDGNNTFKCRTFARDLSTDNIDVVISSVVVVMALLVLGIFILILILIFIGIKRRKKHTSKEIQQNMRTTTNLMDIDSNPIYGPDENLVLPGSLSPSGSLHVFDNSLYTEEESHADTNLTSEYEIPVTVHHSSEHTQVLAASYGYDHLQHQ